MVKRKVYQPIVLLGTCVGCLLFFQNCAPFTVEAPLLSEKQQASNEVGTLPNTESDGPTNPMPVPVPIEIPSADSLDPSKFFGKSRCTDRFDLCEDFESGTISSSWKSYGKLIEVDSARAARGMRSLHITHTGYGRAYIEQSKTFPAPNNTYYGRIFVNFKTLAKPESVKYVHWSIVGANGLIHPGEIRLGGEMRNKLNLFGVGTDLSTETGDWTTTLRSPDVVREVPLDSWICLEWMHKGDTSETKVWWDGVEQKSLATSAAHHGGNQSKPFLLPEFERVWIGWNSYQTNTQTYEMWVDEIVIHSSRVGCDN